ncbi:hypothetical protein [Rossellomorea sp. NRS-1567]|uniref:hypothetical protein n=1 Tax=Rossellomorea sp. NRS-1567 TaxID=3233901 RepID=UPI003D2958E1
MSKHRLRVTNLNVSEISRLFKRDKTETMDTINEMVEKGLFKRIDNETYDISPFIEFQVRFEEEIRKGNSESIDIKKMYYEVTGKHVL